MKNSLKVLSLFAGALLIAAPLTRAADEVSGTAVPSADMPPHEGGPRGGGGMMGERMVKALNLTADQEAKWKAIGEKERAELEALRADTSVAREQKRDKMMSINKGYADQRRAILNADQQKKFDDMRAKMMERGPGPGGKKKKDN